MVAKRINAKVPEFFSSEMMALKQSWAKSIMLKVTYIEKQRRSSPNGSTADGLRLIRQRGNCEQVYDRSIKIKSAKVILVNTE